MLREYYWVSSARDMTCPCVPFRQIDASWLLARNLTLTTYVLLNDGIIFLINNQPSCQDLVDITFTSLYAPTSGGSPGTPGFSNIGKDESTAAFTTDVKNNNYMMCHREADGSLGVLIPPKAPGLTNDCLNTSAMVGEGTATAGTPPLSQTACESITCTFVE